MLLHESKPRFQLLAQSFGHAHFVSSSLPVATFQLFFETTQVNKYIGRLRGGEGDWAETQGSILKIGEYL